MEGRELHTIPAHKNNWIWHILYWSVATLLMFFIFSNRNYDLQIRVVLVGLLIVASYITTLAVNRYMIPKLLFQGKMFRFIYFLFALFILTLWIISLAVFNIVLYSAYSLPDAIIPTREDVIILISGHYIIVIMAAVIHFIRESYQRHIEKNQLAEQKKETEIKFKETRLKLLQGQLHPHFLFNMLNNLYGLVKYDSAVSQKVILKLSELLDYMLYECNKEKVELSKEISFINNYIELERIRHDDDFNVETALPGETDNIKIAPLILFPFVENAFKHGFRDSSENYIRMNLNASPSHLIFTIENSISQIKRDKFLNQEKNGIGLKNIKERLNLIYKDNHKLNINTDDNKYKIHLELNLT